MKRGTIVGLAVGGVAVVAIAASAWWFLTRPQSAEDVARAYLDALAAGDYAAIEALRAEPLEDAVVEEAFAGASSRIAEARVVDVAEQDGGVAGVHAQVELGGEPHDLSFTLEQTDGQWVLGGDDLGLLQVSTTLAGVPVGDSVWIGDALAPAGTDVLLLPAEYPIGAAPRGILTGTATAVVVPGQPATVDLEASLSPEATARAQEQLDVYLDACAAPAAEVPSNCGIRVPWAADLTSLTSIAFRIDERPVLVLSADGTRFDATGGVIVATATGASRAGGTGSVTYRADDWAVRGAVRFKGDEMVLAVR